MGNGQWALVIKDAFHVPCPMPHAPCPLPHYPPPTNQRGEKLRCFWYGYTDSQMRSNLLH
ncbi:MAG: hypothetical protein KME31_12935 [Tolypothrix carrinoi HA7290-LM1]|nr:hypothetical protein [Tolypothrix carrinoi HA7290-LM1]